jgi:hypothetical protein
MALKQWLFFSESNVSETSSSVKKNALIQIPLRDEKLHYGNFSALLQQV